MKKYLVELTLEQREELSHMISNRAFSASLIAKQSIIQCFRALAGENHLSSLVGIRRTCWKNTTLWQAGCTVPPTSAHPEVAPGQKQPLSLTQ
ncbi:MAG TPA: hypothetical protein VN729_05370 [Ktedonobacteraceae bacterium]|jgi:hypothetical protein|nr:hypothetical protein [Ktedonobacteraceae bacterium]